MADTWKTIPGFQDYEASTTGFIRNKYTQKIIKHNVNGGYCQIILYDNKKRFPRKVHRLIAETFIENPEDKQSVNHKDKNRENNCVDNLEWMTINENNNHKVKDNFKRKPSVFRPIWKCDKDTKERLQRYTSIDEAAFSLNPNISTIASNIRSVLCGSVQSAQGFHWQYDDYEEISGEEWKIIPSQHINGTEGYEISTLGRIRKVKNGKMFRGHTDISNYTRVSINDKLYRVHILVAKTFIENPDNKPHVNHKDGQRNNNDVNNLEWCTRSENMKHAYDSGLNKGRGKTLT